MDSGGVLLKDTLCRNDVLCLGWVSDSVASASLCCCSRCHSCPATLGVEWFLLDLGATSWTRGDGNGAGGCGVYVRGCKMYTGSSSSSASSRPLSFGGVSGGANADIEKRGDSNSGPRCSLSRAFGDLGKTSSCRPTGVFREAGSGLWYTLASRVGRASTLSGSSVSSISSGSSASSTFSISCVSGASLISSGSSVGLLSASGPMRGPARGSICAGSCSSAMSWGNSFDEKFVVSLLPEISK